MWEAIEANKRRSWMLIGVMGALLVALGFSIGYAIAPEGGIIGAAGALLLWFILMFVAVVQGDSILLSSAKAFEIQKEDSPRLWNVVEEMTIASGLGTMPKVYVIDSDAPNAFAVGRKQGTAAVAVTSGLLKRLNRDELQGVIAHEIGHIRNLDVRFMTIASVMLGAIVLVADLFLRSLWYGGGRRSSSKGGGQAQLIFLLIALVLAILAPIAAQLLYFACSRRREYLADASAARFTRYPEGLASALEKIASSAADAPKVNRSLAPLYIVNPLQARGAFSLTSTHPPTEKRIAILRGMAGNAGYLAYEAAYQAATGKGTPCLGNRTLSEEERVPVRAPTPELDKTAAAVDRAREAIDLIDRWANFLLIPCACGVRIKVPPQFAGDTISCPRCGTVNTVPRAVADAGKAKEGGAAAPLQYQRTSTGWESFKCSCGRVIQLSPIFAARRFQCPDCRRPIHITPSAEKPHDAPRAGPRDA